IGLSVSYFLHPLDRVPGVEEQPPAGSLVVVEHDAPVAHALQVAADLLRLAVLSPRHELHLYGLVYPVVEFHYASFGTLLDTSLILQTSYATRVGATQDLASELPRIPIPRTRMNNGKSRCLSSRDPSRITQAK